MGRKKKYNTEEERIAANRESQRKHYQANKERYQQYYQNNKEYIQQYYQQYYQDNKEYFQQYRQDNKEYILQYSQQYRQDNKEAIAEKRKEWYNKKNYYNKEYYSTLNGMCSSKSSSYRAYDRKRFGTDESSITAEQMQEMIELHPHCFYCGCEDISKLGLDRIDNSKPHTVDNCVVCCGKCNVKRHTMSFEEFVKIKSN